MLIILGFLRHGQEGLNNETQKGGTATGYSPRGIIQCHLHPAIPYKVAPQQSLAPFHRAIGLNRSMFSGPRRFGACGREEFKKQRFINP